jgi:formyltetrahydrofolate hydrolase
VVGVALIERLMGLEEPKIPVHQFQATIAEWARGSITGAQAQVILSARGGQVLSSAEVAARAMRLIEIDQVFLLAEYGVTPYNTAAAVRARLGI